MGDAVGGSVGWGSAAGGAAAGDAVADATTTWGAATGGAAAVGPTVGGILAFSSSGTVSSLMSSQLSSSAGLVLSWLAAHGFSSTFLSGWIG